MLCRLRSWQKNVQFTYKKRYIPRFPKWANYNEFYPLNDFGQDLQYAVIFIHQLLIIGNTSSVMCVYDLSFCKATVRKFFSIANMEMFSEEQFEFFTMRKVLLWESCEQDIHVSVID